MGLCLPGTALRRLETLSARKISLQPNAAGIRGENVRALLTTIIIMATAPAMYADFVDPPGLKDRYHGMAYDVLEAA